MLELRQWLCVEVGAHPLCALRIAICAVEVEAGRNEQPATCSCNGIPKCETKARAAWKDRPRGRKDKG
jgi:hypothetical protein